MIALHILLFICIMALCYYIIRKIVEDRMIERINRYINEKNAKYYEEFLKKYEKNKKIKITDKFNLMYKLNILIDRANIGRNIIINPVMVILYSFLVVMIAYHLAYGFLKIPMLSLVIALPCVFIPVLVIQSIAAYKEERVEKVFLNFLLQVKNYTKISNDITTALKEVDIPEPLKSHIKKFNIEIDSGMKFEVAIEHLKEKISIAKFREFFSNLEYCYLYGGSFPNLIDKNYKMISELQTEKNKRLQETKGARVVLMILMALNIFVYVTYIKNNYDNYLIMQRSFIGMAILYWNFISMWILLWLSMKVKKLDY